MFGSRNFLFAKAISAIPLSGGKLFMWGQGNFGQLGIGDTANRSSPVQVGALTDWAKFETGNHTVATKTDGTLWTWGFNNYGALGLNDTAWRSSPVQVGALTGWATPVAGFASFSLSIKDNGTLWSWGRGNYGSLGLGNTTNYSSPKQIGSLTNWSKATASYAVLAVNTDGKLFAWGYNNYGQLGLGDTANRSSPVQVGALTNWATPSAGRRHSLCVKTDGTLWVWGNGGNGRLGLGNTTSYSSPKQVGSLTDWATPTGGDNFSLCTKTNGSLWSWGGGAYGQLGLGGPYAYSSPKQIGALTNWSVPSASTLSSFCIKTDGTLWAWGYNGAGRLGLGNTTQRLSPVQIGSSSLWFTLDGGIGATGAIEGVATAAPSNLTLPVITGTAEQQSVLSCSTGTWRQFPTSFAYQWQRGTSNIVGATSSTYTIDAADVGSTLRCVVTATNGIGSTPATSASTAVVTAYVGRLFGWGYNGQGQLGLNNTTRYDSPVQVGALTNWKTPSGGSNNGNLGFTLCTKADGSLWSWGANQRGQLGSDTVIYRSSPVQVGSLTNWSKISAGYRSSICIKTDGTLWSWGSNASFGGLGLGDTINRSSPVQVGSLTDWNRVSNTGLDFCIATKTNGQLWAWGRNHYGQLGNGNTTYFSSPIQIGSSTNWYIASNGRSHTACTTTDGKLFIWGDNAQGQLGLGDTVKRSSPVQVGALTNWKQPMGGYAQTLCIKTDGSLWAVGGNNGTGELGLGDTVSRSSPVQIGSLTNWSLLRQGNANGSTTPMCVKTDGTLWAWGNGGVGQTGQGYGAFFSSPKQIGTLTSWLIPTQAGNSVLSTRG